MDKKTIVIVSFLVVILIFWSQIANFLGIIPKQTQPPVAPGRADTVLVQKTTPETVAASTTAAAPITAAVTPAAAVIAPIDSLIPEKIITVTTPLQELTFSTKGGGLRKIVLTQYKYRGDGGVVLADGVNKVVPDFETGDGSFQAALLPFTCEQSDMQIAKGGSPARVSFTYDNGRGGKMIKTYTISPDRYDLGFDFSIEGIENFGFERSYRMVWGITPSPTELDLKDDYGYYKVVAMADKHIELDSYNDNVMNEEVIGATMWAGLRTKYFTCVMIPKTRPAEGVVALGTKQSEMVKGAAVETRQLSAALTMAMPAHGTLSDNYVLYSGPIHYGTLKGYGVGLEELTSLGWVIIKPFSIAIIWLLPKIYTVIPNYGVVVLLFSLLVKVLIYPLTRKQVVAMAKMKDLAPKMKDIQEKYKQDPARMNKEVMKLYKEAGANPMSGCLTMLPQLPLFFALFTVFRTTIEFRGASFVGWIVDLSVPDPLYVLPVIMTIVMFVQQKMTVSDPKQKMLVYIFPLFFGWMSLNFPAGLVMYWSGFSILSFIEQMYLVKKPQDAVTVVKN